MKKIVLFIGIGFLFSCGDNETLQVGQKQPWKSKRYLMQGR